MTKDALCEVSCKVVIFNRDLSKILMLKYTSGLFGIPGGHVDEGECNFEKVARREVKEEVGLDLDTITAQNIEVETKKIKLGELFKINFYARKRNQRRIDRGDFKIVLGYAVIVDEDTELLPTRTEPEEGISGCAWVDTGKAISFAKEVGYEEFVIEAIESARQK